MRVQSTVEQKYRVIRRLEAGGMAEVYLGEAVSVQGFKKRVAIKRVLPHLAQNDSFIQMFLDEARLSARLNHANIVSVFDISAREDTFFLIMEFVDGGNLKKIMESLHKRGQRIKLAESIFICIEACRGLSYAHELADESGTPLGIVHRDISPPNIMVTRRGEVKVADFGLAKAGTQLQTTDPGVVKGKFSYLSPEAANGLEVDARADVFSLGIVLWEMLAGKRLFFGENDYSTVKLIQKANIPRLAPLNRQVDEAFEEVLVRALARDPRHRYQSAREFGDALAGYLFNHQLKVTSYDLANLVATATDDDGAGVTGDPALIDRLIQEELNDSVGIGGNESGSLPKMRGSDPEPEMRLGETFEDPASWFSDDQELDAAPGALGGGDPQTLSGSWHESGLDAVDAVRADRTTEEIDIGLGAEVVEMVEREPPPPMPAPPRSAAATAVTTEKGGGAGKYVVLALLAVAIAAVAWLGIRL